MRLRLSYAAMADCMTRRRFAAAGLKQETIVVDSDTTIRLWWHPHPDPQPLSKPFLLLIHGFGPSAPWQWRAQIGPLSCHFNLIVPDLVFFGGSATLSVERSERFQAEAILALLRKLRISGRDLAGVVGTSYGGFVAYHLARIMIPPPGKLVIASSDLGKTEEDDRRFAERVSGAHSPADALLPTTPDDFRRLLRLVFHRPPWFQPNFLLRDFLRHLYSDNIEEKKELLKGITLGNRELFQLTPLTQDTLIIWGEHDNIFPLNKAHELNKKLGANTRLEVLKNTGHMPQIEDPKQFNKVLLSFLLTGTEAYS